MPGETSPDPTAGTAANEQGAPSPGPAPATPPSGPRADSVTAAASVASPAPAAPATPISTGTVPASEPAIAVGTVRRAPATGRLATLKGLGRRAVGAVRSSVERLGRNVLSGMGLRLESDDELAGMDKGRLDILRALADRKRAPRVLFVDGTNAGRSQMAEAYAVTLGLYAESAGTFPSPRLDPAAVAVMQERGLDIAAWGPKILLPSRLVAFDRVIVMGDVMAEPLLRQAHVEKWSFPLDPAGFPLEGYRMVRDQTERQVRTLAKRLAGLKTRRTKPAPPLAQPKRTPPQNPESGHRTASNPDGSRPPASGSTMSAPTVSTATASSSTGPASPPTSALPTPSAPGGSDAQS